MAATRSSSRPSFLDPTGNRGLGYRVRLYKHVSLSQSRTGKTCGKLEGRRGANVRKCSEIFVRQSTENIVTRYTTDSVTRFKTQRVLAAQFGDRRHESGRRQSGRCSRARV